MKINIILIFLTISYMILYTKTIGLNENESYYKEGKSFKDSCNCVKDSLDAIKIAEKEWIKVFGEEVLKEKPFIAILVDTIWYVRGTSHIPTQEELDKENLDYAGTGGTAFIEINQKNCKVLALYHEE